MSNRRYLLLGCELTAGNLGVSALGHALVKWLMESDPECEMQIQTPGLLDPVELETPDGMLKLDGVPLHYSRSLRARFGTRVSETLHACHRLTPRAIRPLLPFRNSAFESLQRADVVIDVSAGDSFAEIYGPKVFQNQCGIKESVLNLGIPLVLAPQTIGPFATDGGRERARRILDRCTLVATRDAFGLDELSSLMGGSLDERFVICPDMAFGLDAAGECPALWSGGEASRRPVIGINVSEMLYYDTVEFGIRSNHRELIHSLVEMFLRETDSDVLLVPHVLPHMRFGPDGAFPSRSDVDACEDVARSTDHYFGRVTVLRDATTAPRVKRAIGCCDFFVGGRMHACIAALSQSVPTASLAYSKKVAGVMGKLGVSEAAVDLRQLDLSQALDRVRSLHLSRDELRQSLDQRVPVVLNEIRTFFDRTLPAATRIGELSLT